MKQIFLIFALLFSLGVFAQVPLNISLTADTARGNENVYFTPANTFQYSDGYVGFFAKTVVSGAGTTTAADVYLQGSQDATNFINIDTVANVGEQTFFIYQQNPYYTTYRLYLDGTAGDTVIVSPVKLVYKPTKKF